MIAIPCFVRASESIKRKASCIGVCLALAASLSSAPAFAESGDTAAGAPAAVKKRTEPEEVPLGTQGKIGLVTLGVSGATLVTGIVTGVLELRYNEVVEDRCDPVTKACDDEGRAATTAAASLSTASTVTFIVGGVGFVAGSILMLTRNLGKPAPVSAGIVVLPGHASAVISGRF